MTNVSVKVCFQKHRPLRLCTRAEPLQRSWAMMCPYGGAACTSFAGTGLLSITNNNIRALQQKHPFFFLGLAVELQRILTQSPLINTTINSFYQYLIYLSSAISHFRVSVNTQGSSNLAPVLTSKYRDVSVAPRCRWLAAVSPFKQSNPYWSV